MDSAESNSQIISINNTVHGVLKNGDLRRNYILTGATWMIAFFSGSTFDPTQVGTSDMANTTMETFSQGLGNFFTNDPFLNCFGCHDASKHDTNVSHIFGDSILAPIGDATIGTVTLPSPHPYQGSTKDYHVKVNVTNTGTNNWTPTSGDRLGVKSVMRLHEKSISSIAATVSPESTVTFDVVVSCDSNEFALPGGLTLQMKKSKTWFGQNKEFSVCQKSALTLIQTSTRILMTFTLINNFTAVHIIQ